jgi:group I intron endonuclease
MLVYIAKNIVNNKVYIGITKRNLEKRVYEHLYSSNIPNKYLTIRFYNSIRKYGKDNIKWDILCECNSVEELLKKEEYFINLYDSTNPDKGYNMLKSSTFLNYKHTKEFKDNLSLLKTDVKSKNRRGVPGSSNYFGVVYIKTSGKWSSRITINKKLIFISNYFLSGVSFFIYK